MRASISICVLAGTLSLAACKYGDNSMPSPNRLVLGYYTGDTASLASAEATDSPLNEVAMDLVSVDANGDLHGDVPGDLLASDQSQGKLSYVTVSNFGATDFDPNIAHGAMVTHHGATLANIVSLAKTVRLTGINIDFEGLFPADRDAYTQFVTELAAQLHSEGSLLMLSIPAKNSDDPGDSWTGAFDYAALGKAADFLQVMTYDEHVPGQPPGPVAGLDWMSADLHYAVSQIDADKILSGLPAYGYDFDVTHNSGVQVAWKDSAALAQATGAHPVWDPVSESEHFDYTASDGSSHQVWYETAQGIQDKAHLAVTLKLAGVSMWALGLENRAFWSAVNSGLN